MYPRVNIYIKNIVENARHMKAICDERGVKLSVVTKLVSDCPEIVKYLLDSGVDCICESRMENVKSYSALQAEKWYIREPMLSEVEDVVRYTDVSLNSEYATLAALNEAAKSMDRIHRVILMYELGDLREGAERTELFDLIEKTLAMSNLELYGLGANLSCYGGVVPSDENMRELSELVTEAEARFGIQFQIVSGGNSSAFNMLRENRIPANINNFRFGESIYLGNVPCFEVPIEDFHRNNFVLEAQIVELKEKESVPRGVSMTNCFGEQLEYVDYGRRKRAIVAVGKQDISVDGLIPTDEKIAILGSSSDYIILDVSDSDTAYKTGDLVRFNMNYAATLRAMTSEYVHKQLITE